MKKLRRTYQKKVKKVAKRHQKLKRHFLVAGTTAAISVGTVSLSKAWAADALDPHQLPVSQDMDVDLLTDQEELNLSSNPCISDQNINGIPDGIELAALCKQRIDLLPWNNEEKEPTETYKWWNPQFGLHTCDICGATMPMGPGGIVNPKLRLSVQFDFELTLHYLSHGSFSYAGHYGDDPVQARIDIPLLVKALEINFPFTANDHQLSVTNDADKDLLSSCEEHAIGYQPFEPDQNQNDIPDGAELAKRCSSSVHTLPHYNFSGTPPKEIYKIEHALDGLEQCHICGQWIHMGGWEIINPILNLRYPDPNDHLNAMFLPDLALHYMDHGSFQCKGSIHTGRVNVQRLLRVLDIRFPYDPNEHQLPLDYVIGSESPPLAKDTNDLDRDLMADSEELTAGFNLYDPDQNQNLIPDGIELAKRSAAIINTLPLYDPAGGDSPPKETYRWCLYQKGLEQCFICGATVNMGPAGIVNPKLGLEITCPLIAVHYMEHGSFSYDGRTMDSAEPLHAGRLDIPLLVEILELPARCGDLGTLNSPGDLNNDCKVDLKDFLKFSEQWLQSTHPN